MVKEGESIPEFELKDSNGNTYRKNDLSGKKSVIYFYSEDFSPGCTTQADEFTKKIEQFNDKKISIIGISKDSQKSHQEFCDKQKIPYTVLSDTNSIVAKKFGAWGIKGFSMSTLRNTYLINEKGVIFKIFKEINPRGHAQQVLDAF